MNNTQRTEALWSIARLRNLAGLLIFALTTAFAHAQQATNNPTGGTNNIPLGGSTAIGRFTLRQRGTELYNNGYIRFNSRLPLFQFLGRFADRPNQLMQMNIARWSMLGRTNSTLVRPDAPNLDGWVPAIIDYGQYDPAMGGYGFRPPRPGSTKNNSGGITTTNAPTGGTNAPSGGGNGSGGSGN